MSDGRAKFFGNSRFITEYFEGIEIFRRKKEKKIRMHIA